MATLYKELSRLLKKSFVIVMLVVAPFVTAGIVLLFYINLDIQDMKIGVLNLDKDERSAITVSFIMRFFKGANIEKVSKRNYLEKLLNGEVKAVLVIPEGFMEKVYSKKKSEVWYIPSPYDLQISVGAYTALKSLFEDLAGGIFVDLGATSGSCIRKMLFSYKAYPPPYFVTKKPSVKMDFPPPSIVFLEKRNEEKFGMDFVLSPAVLILSGVLTVLTLSIHSVIDDRERGLLDVMKVAGAGYLGYSLSYIIVYTLIGILASSFSYVIAFLITGITIPLEIRLSVITLTSVFYASLGFLVSSISPTRSVSTLLMMIFVVASFFASGNFVALSSTPGFMRNLISHSIVYNANMILRKVMIFRGVGVAKEMITILIWSGAMFSAAIFSGKYALRRC